MLLVAAVLAVGTQAQPLRLDVTLPLPTPAPRTVSAPWIVAPAVCHALDLGTALWADSRGHLNEANPVLSSDGHIGARGLALKAGGILVAAGGTYLLGQVLHQRAGAKAFAAASCGVALAGAASNVGAWHP